MSADSRKYVNCSRPLHFGFCITHDDCRVRLRAEVDRLHALMDNADA